MYLFFDEFNLLRKKSFVLKLKQSWLSDTAEETEINTGFSTHISGKTNLWSVRVNGMYGHLPSTTGVVTGATQNYSDHT